MPSKATWGSASCSCCTSRPATSCCPRSPSAVKRSAPSSKKVWHTEPGNSDPTYLTHQARIHLRSKFLGADIAMTGVNFAVAEAGAFAVCTNEGNADLGTSFPDLHIAIMGLEKVIPRLPGARRLHPPAGPLGHRTARNGLHLALPTSRTGQTDPRHHRR